MDDGMACTLDRVTLVNIISSLLQLATCLSGVLKCQFMAQQTLCPLHILQRMCFNFLLRIHNPFDMTCSISTFATWVLPGILPLTVKSVPRARRLEVGSVVVQVEENPFHER